MKIIWHSIKFLVSLFLVFLAVFSLVFSEDERRLARTGAVVLLIMAVLPWIINKIHIKSRGGRLVSAVNHGIEHLVFFIMLVSLFGLMTAVGMSPSEIVYYGKLVLGAMLAFGSIIFVAIFLVKSHLRAVRKSRSSVQLRKVQSKIYNLTKDNSLSDLLQGRIHQMEAISSTADRIDFSFLLLFAISFLSGVLLIGSAFNIF